MTFNGLDKIRIGSFVRCNTGKGFVENSFEDLFGVTQYIILNQTTGERERVFEGEIHGLTKRKYCDEFESRPTETFEET
tara:strand:- start:57 stop:293 length:237 start_codon:yes stop_codon:yes gene_type:complete